MACLRVFGWYLLIIFTKTFLLTTQLKHQKFKLKAVQIVRNMALKISPVKV